MTEERVLSLLPHLPDGISEIYFHPAAAGSASLARTMPDYRHADEFAALVNPEIRRRIADSGIGLISYGDLVGVPCKAGSRTRVHSST